MKRFFRSLAACLLFATTPALFVHCGGETLLGTETGNPPGIDSLKLYLERTADGVRVVGSPGAVTPGGAQVTVTNLSTGERVETSATADGSLDVPIAGAPGDEYEVTASSGGQQVTLAVSSSQLAAQQNIDGLSCEALERSLGETLRAAYEGADTTCSVDTDCAPLGSGTTPRCYNGCGGELELALSLAGRAAAGAAALALTEAVCAGLDSCEREPPPPCAGGSDYQIPACRAGQCQAVNPITAACDNLNLATRSRFIALVNATDRTCSEDSDCLAAQPSATCVHTCGSQYAIARAAADDLTARIQAEIEQPVCGIVDQRGCQEAEPPCLPGPPQQAACRSGECVLVPIE
jgi:hypothetical protein